jgi:hypothetical protein
MMLLAALLETPAMGSGIGSIEFFGYKGIDTASLRKALPVREGDAYSEETEDLVRQAVVRAIGKPPTDVASVCCDEKGNWLLFVGLPGESYKGFTYLPQPRGEERLPMPVMELHKRLIRAIEGAVRKGGDGIQEDDSKGYALFNDPAAHALQLELRQLALKHERELLRVLEFSSEVEHRRVASNALGYAHQSRRQIRALGSAARDADAVVRNNATRALGVLVRSSPKLATEVVPDTFIEMLNSGTWSDRNKAAMLLDGLTAARSPQLLARIRSTALDSLIEMASWRRPGHAYYARRVLGRVAGLPEKQLHELAWKGPVEVIVAAAHGR